MPDLATKVITSPGNSIGPKRDGLNRREFLRGTALAGATAVATNFLPGTDSFEANKLHAAEANISRKRIDGSTWNAHSADIDDYLESVILNASRAGVLKSEDDFKRLNPTARPTELQNQFEDYVSDWKEKAKVFQKPKDLSRFLSGIYILKGRDNEANRIISDEQAQFLLNHYDLITAKTVMEELYAKVLAHEDLNLIKVEAGKKIFALSQRVAQK